MDKGIKVFVGLDVHKDSISVGVAEASGGEARFVCTLAHDVAKSRKYILLTRPNISMVITFRPLLKK